MRKKDRFQFRKLFVFFLSFALLILHVPTQVHAANGDFSIDFAAAAPFSYSHLTGGGAFDDGTIGTHADVVESLQGGDFRCGDLVTYLVRITVNDTDSAAADAPQTIRLDFSFLADTTGQPGVGLVDIKSVKVNYGSVQDLIPSEDQTDSGIMDDGGSQATLVDEHLIGTPFTSGALLLGSVVVDDLERNETVIVRIDVKLGCKPGSDPTGNLQADLQSAWLIVTGAGAVEPPQAIPGGAQTIPFKQIGDIGAADIEIEKTVRIAGTSDNFTDSVTILNGASVEYRYVVTNLATTQPPGAPLYDVTVMDDNGTPANSADDFAVSLSGLTDIDGDGHSDDLAIGGTATGTETRTISTVAESVVNTAKASGKDSIYLPNILTDTDTATVHVEHPSISLEKTGALVDQNGNGRTDVGDKITYAFRIENTGNVNLTNVRLSDPKITLTGGPIASLAPGAINTTAYTGIYWLTQADIDAGTFQNVATVTGTPPRGPDVTDTDDDIQTLARTPAIQLEKTGTLVDQNGNGLDDVGDKITYAFTVRNIGNVTLTNVTVTDKVGGVAISGSPIASLAPGAINTTAFTGVYWLTQAVIDAGMFTNIATATGTKPGGGTVSDDDDDTQTLTRNPSIQLEKTGTYTDQNHDSIANVGDKITYAFVVHNTGNVTLTQMTVTDKVGGVTISGGPLTSLAPGAIDSTTFTGVYWLTQADIDAGMFTNIATATGTKPGGGTVSDEDDDTQVFARMPSIHLEKTGTLVDQNGDGIDSTGDRITYTFTVRNTGNVTLTNIRLTDPLISISGGPLASLAPGAIDSTTFTGVYQLTQADIDAGTFTNIANVTGTPPVGPDVTDTDDDTQRFVRNPALTLEKSGTFDAGGDGYADPGELITYVFVVRNTGNVTLRHVTVTDPLPGLSAITLPKSTLAVGESMTGTATYAVTQADIDVGFVANLATADSDESGPDDDDHHEPLPQNPMLELTKSGAFDAGSDGYADPGELITYTFVVRNTDNVTLHHVTVTDPLPGLSAISLPKSTLAVGESMTGTATYAVTQADIDAGFVANLATADSDESGPDDDDHNQPLPQNPMLELLKSGNWVDGNGDGWADAGETVIYFFTVQNTGNVTLHHVTVTDPKIPLITYVSGDDGDDALQVDETWIYTADYLLTQVDIDAGFVYNLAVADSDESDDDVGDENILLPQQAGIQIVKTTNGIDGPEIPVGATVTWRYVVTNTGNVTLTEINVTDDQDVIPVYVSGDLNSDGKLDLAEAWIFEATGMAVEGAYENTGTASGSPPEGDRISDEDTSGYFGYILGIHLEKDVANWTQKGLFADYAELEEDETARYRLTIRNNSNVSLIHVIVTDTEAKPGTVVTMDGGGTLVWTAGSGDLAELSIGSLAAGAHIVLTYDYRTLHSDIGEPIVNTAIVTGVPGEELHMDEYPALYDEDEATISVEAIPLVTTSISIRKQVRNQTVNGLFADMATGYAGDIFCYFVEITNDGQTLLSHVTLTDDRAVIGSQLIRTGDEIQLTWADDGHGKARIVIGELKPGESVGYLYRVTATEDDEGESITNTATVNADFLPTVPGYEIIPLEKSDAATIMVLEPPPITGENGQPGQVGAGVLLLTLAAAILIMRQRLRPMELVRGTHDAPEGLDPN